MACTAAQLKAAKKYRLAHKEVVSKRKKTWRTNNKNKTKVYNAVHKQAQNDWKLNNKERISKTAKSWRVSNLERKKETDKNWKENNLEKTKIIANRCRARRKRNLGFIPLNKKFPGSVGHHIDKEFVIHMPEELHKSIPHSQGDLESMYKINIEARGVLL